MVLNMVSRPLSMETLLLEMEDKLSWQEILSTLLPPPYICANKGLYMKKYKIKIQKYKNTKIQKYKNTIIQIYKYTNMQIYKYTNTKIQKYKNTNTNILHFMEGAIQVCYKAGVVQTLPENSQVLHKCE